MISTSEPEEVADGAKRLAEELEESETKRPAIVIGVHRNLLTAKMKALRAKDEDESVSSRNG